MLNIKTKLRRAFTIVELVVVIAVIAALAAILIPTFANVIKSANESADMQLVKNLNTILATDEAINGAPSTMDDVLAVTSENGYNIDKLTPSSSGDIVWDKNTNRFVLINEDGEVIYYDDSYDAEEAVLWYITDSTTILTDKNYYYANAVTTDNGSLTLTSGADLSNTEVESVTINANNTQISVTVNNAAVTVSSDSDSTVNLYGTISTVEGTYGTNSLHIYGTVTGKIELSSGRVVAEKGSYIESIIITAETLSSIKIEAESSSSINSIGAITSDVAAGISSISTGVSSSAIVSTAVFNDFAGGAGTEASPYQIATAQQFANIGNLSDAMKTGTAYYFKLIDDIDLRDLDSVSTAISSYFCGVLDGGDKNLIANDNLTYIFMDAVGTTTFTDINYQLVSKNVSLCPGFSSSFDTTLTFDNVDYSTVVDGEVIVFGDNNEGIVMGSLGYTYMGSAWLGTTYSRCVIIKNCDVDVDISSAYYNGVFIGGNVYHTDAIIQDCTYWGNYYGACANLALGNSYDYGSSLTISNVVNKGAIYGTARIPMIAGGSVTTNATEASWATIENCNLGTHRYLTDTRLGIAKDTTDGSVVITQAYTETEYYVLKFTGGTRTVSADSQNSSYTFSILLNPTFDASYLYDTGYTDGKLVTVAQYEEITGTTSSFSDDDAIEVYSEEGAKLWIVTYESTVYYVFEFADSSYFFGKTGSAGAVDINSVAIIAYDSDNIPIAQKDLSLK